MVWRPPLAWAWPTGGRASLWIRLEGFFTVRRERGPPQGNVQMRLSLIVAFAAATAAALPIFFNNHPLSEEVVPTATKLVTQPAAPAVVEPILRNPQAVNEHVEQVAEQGEASVEQVEADLKRMGTFSAEVRRTLDESDKTTRDVQQALGYFRRQSQLNQDARDSDKSRVQSLEAEVANLQRRIQSLEAEKKALQTDKVTLTEANAKVIRKLNSMFAFGQSVQNGLALSGLAAASSNATSDA